MSDITVQDVLTGAMSLIGDADGEISQEIVDDYQTAYGNVMALALKLGLPQIQREVYYTLPANTGALFASQLGVNDFSEPVRIWERGGLTTVAITGTADGAQNIVVQTTTGHGRTTGDRVELNNITLVPGWVNRDWLITVTDATHFQLNGSIPCGVSGVGGTMMFSRERFSPVDLVGSIGSQELRQTLGQYQWQNNAIWFTGSNQVRQLWIEYLATSDAPLSGVIGFANGNELNYLKHATAAHFAPKRQMPQGPQLKMDAYGSSGEPDGGGGLLRSLILPMLKQRQGMVLAPRPFRRRRGLIPGFR